MLIYFNAELGELRTASFAGSDHLIVPLIALREQVMHSANAPEPELTLESEFAISTPSWNGRPVVIDHPQLNGQMVSANLPSILETEEVGKIFNAKTEDGKLKLEAWINLARVEELGGRVKETVDRLQNDEMVEVSTGFFADVDIAPGVFKGKEFAGILRNILPDHLAILSSGIGACSVEDGCGAPRINAAVCNCGTDCGGTCNMPKIREFARKPVFNGVETIAPPQVIPALSVGQKISELDKEKRTTFANGSLFGLSDGETLIALSYMTVVNPETGKLNRQLLTNTLNDVELDKNLSDDAKASATFTINGLLGQHFGVTSEKGGVWDKIKSLLRGNADLSDQDRRSAIQSAMDLRDADAWQWVLAVFSDHFIFETWNGLFSQTFSINDGGLVTLGEEVVAVRPETKFVPVQVNQHSPSEDDTGNPEKESNMDKEAFISSLIANQATRFSEDDREFLDGLDEKVLEKMEPVEAAPIEDPEAAGAPIVSIVNNAAPTVPTVEEFLATAPADVRSVLNQGLALQKQQRMDLTKAIKSNSRNKFSDEQLAGFDLDQLFNMAELAGDLPADFTGNGGPRTPVVNATADETPAMPKVFEVKAA